MRTITNRIACVRLHHLSRLTCFFSLAFCFLFLPSAQSQSRDTVERAVLEEMSNRFVRNYDSLLNSFLMTKYAHVTQRGRAAASGLESFDRLPDSVIAARLRAMHTVIPMNYNDVVRAHIRMYLSRMSSRIDVMLTLSEFYGPVFESALARYNVPEELKYLPIIESAMNPQATSRMGAAGLWQFMYTTGKNYGLEVNSLIDERRDTYKSSDAAAHYLHDLYEIFHDWNLAIAAYNCGPGNINKAIARSGGKTTFWEIYNYLPRETRGYIPSFIAATYVMTYYPEHGLRPGRISIPLRTDTVMIEKNLYFCHISKYIGISLEELRALNPQYRADFIPGDDGSYPLCLPNDKMNDLINWADTIFAATADSLSRTPVTLSVHQKGGSSSSYSNSLYHKVRRGETLSSIASKHGTSVKRLKKLNNLKSDIIREGQRLRVR